MAKKKKKKKKLILIYPRKTKSGAMTAAQRKVFKKKGWV